MACAVAQGNTHVTVFHSGRDDHIEFVIAVEIGHDHRSGKCSAGNRVGNCGVVVGSITQQHYDVNLAELAGHEHDQVLLVVGVHISGCDRGSGIARSTRYKELLLQTKFAGAVSDDHGRFSTNVLLVSDQQVL